MKAQAFHYQYLAALQRAKNNYNRVVWICNCNGHYKKFVISHFYYKMTKIFVII